MKSKKEKAIFRIAFLEGEIEVEKTDNTIIIPLISEEKKIKNKKITEFNSKNNITFYRSKKTENKKPIFLTSYISVDIRHTIK